MISRGERSKCRAQYACARRGGRVASLECQTPRPLRQLAWPSKNNSQRPQSEKGGTLCVEGRLSPHPTSKARLLPDWHHRHPPMCHLTHRIVWAFQNHHLCEIAMQPVLGTRTGARRPGSNHAKSLMHTSRWRVPGLPSSGRVTGPTNAHGPADGSGTLWTAAEIMRPEADLAILGSAVSKSVRSVWSLQAGT